MFENFFLSGPIPENAETGTYTLSLVLLSYVTGFRPQYYIAISQRCISDRRKIKGFRYIEERYGIQHQVQTGPQPDIHDMNTKYGEHDEGREQWLPQSS